jgi:Domain of unknown function (DUF3859)
MRVLPQLFIFLSGIVVANAEDQQARVAAIDIVETGIYEARQVARIPTPENAVGPIKLITDVQLVRKTTTIPARVGLRFGLRYRPIGDPLGSVSSLQLVVRYPGRGLRDAKTGTFMSDSKEMVRRTIGDVHHFGFTFDTTSELAPGIWTFEIWQEDRRIVAQEFDIVRAR